MNYRNECEEGQGIVYVILKIENRNCKAGVS